MGFGRRTNTKNAILEGTLMCLEGKQTRKTPFSRSSSSKSEKFELTLRKMANFPWFFPGRGSNFRFFQLKMGVPGQILEGRDAQGGTKPRKTRKSRFSEKRGTAGSREKTRFFDFATFSIFGKTRFWAVFDPILTQILADFARLRHFFDEILEELANRGNLRILIENRSKMALFEQISWKIRILCLFLLPVEKSINFNENSPFFVIFCCFLIKKVSKFEEKCHFLMDRAWNLEKCRKTREILKNPHFEGNTSRKCQNRHFSSFLCFSHIFIKHALYIKKTQNSREIV